MPATITTNGDFSGILIPAISNAIRSRAIAPKILIILILNKFNNLGPRPAAKITTRVAIIPETKAAIIRSLAVPSNREAVSTAPGPDMKRIALAGALAKVNNPEAAASATPPLTPPIPKTVVSQKMLILASCLCYLVQKEMILASLWRRDSWFPNS